MNEERRDLVEGVEDKAVAPHDYRDGVIAEGESVGGEEEPLRIGKAPYRQDREEVDEVAKVGEEVVISSFLVFDQPYRHEKQELYREPIVEVLWDSTDQISRDEDVQHCRNECHLLLSTDGCNLAPSS